MDLFKNDINFVTDDLKGFIEKNDLPETKVKNFTSRIKYALLLGFKEKEIFFFGLIQWLAILLAYLLWVQNAALDSTRCMGYCSKMPRE